MTTSDDDVVATLPEVFRTAEALAHVSERTFRRLVDTGRVIAISRGLYRTDDWVGDEDLAEIAARSSRAVLCLRSALGRHELIDDIPAEIDVAIPRGAWTPETTAPVRWHHFDADTFVVGREDLDLGGAVTIGIYSAERSIVDAFRMRHLEGPDLGIDALKSWLRRGGQPSELLLLAREFPRAVAPLRDTLAILL